MVMSFPLDPPPFLIAWLLRSGMVSSTNWNVGWDSLEVSCDRSRVALCRPTGFLKR